MKQILFVLIGMIGILAACTTKNAAELCPAATETAVIVYLVNDQNDPLSGVTLSYRLDREAWQSFEEAVDGETGLGTAAGQYEIRAEKSGYQPAETAVTVPGRERVARGVMCGLTTQNVTLQLARVCQEPEQELTAVVTFVGERLTAVTGQMWQSQGLTLDYQLLNDEWQAAQCTATPGHSYSCTANLGNADLPATIRFLANQPGYPYVEQTRTVTRSATGCLLLSEPLRFETADSCAATTRSLQMNVTSSATGAFNPVLYALSPNNSKQQLPCTQREGNLCRQYGLDLTAFGAYQISVEELPHEAYLHIIDDVVHYRYDSYEIELQQGQRPYLISGEGAGTATLDLAVQPDEAGCPWIDWRQVTHTAGDFAPFADALAEQTVDVRLQSSVLMTGLNDAACLREPEITAVPYKVILPPGIHLSDVNALYYSGSGNEWKTAVCDIEAGEYLCTAYLPNPVRSQSVAIKATIAGVDYVGLQIPSTSALCVIFR